jgi:hypothetical protein
MHKIGKLNKNLIAITLVFMLIIVIYSATSTINMVAKDPIECEETFFSTKDVCYNPNRIAFNNYQTSIDVKIENANTNINGLKVRIFGEQGIKSLVFFKTIKKDGEATISIPYEKEIYGEVQKIELKPILNLNQEIIYCNLNNGNIIEQEISECE